MDLQKVGPWQRELVLRGSVGIQDLQWLVVFPTVTTYTSFFSRCVLHTFLIIFAFCFILIGLVWPELHKGGVVSFGWFLSQSHSQF